MHPKPWIGLAEAERGSRAQGWSAKPCPSHAAAGSPRLHRAPRGAEGAEPGTRRACVVCVPRAAAAATAAAAAAATSAFGSRIRNPCAQLTMKQSSNVPAFLSKLWTLVEETHTNEFITWSQVQSGTPWPRVSLVEPARLDSARLGSAGLGWARRLPRPAAARGLPTSRGPPALCARRAGPAGSVRLRPRAVGEGSPVNGPAGPGSSEPAPAARSAHSSSVVCSPRSAEVAEPGAGERAIGRAWGLSKEITSAGIACSRVWDLL